MRESIATIVMNPTNTKVPPQRKPAPAELLVSSADAPAPIMPPVIPTTPQIQAASQFVTFDIKIPSKIVKKVERFYRVLAIKGRFKIFFNDRFYGRFALESWRKRTVREGHLKRGI
jgi:hypothetical protein